MGSLLSLVQDPSRRPAVIADCERVLEGEVRRRGGVVGIAVRTAYGAVGRLDDGRLVHNVIDALLDEFAAAVDPLVAEHRALPESGRPGLAAYLTERSVAVADALLTVTDRERDRVTNPVLIRAYNGLRGTAERLVAGGVPALAVMLETHLDGSLTGP